MTKQERAALKDVNRIRRAEGRKPLTRLPKGIPNDGVACPIARALDHGQVNVGGSFEGDVEVPFKKLAAYMKAGLRLPAGTRVRFLMPQSFKTFVKWFDAQADAGAQALKEDA